MPPLTTLEKPTPQNLPTPPAKHCPAVKPCPPVHHLFTAALATKAPSLFCPHDAAALPVLHSLRRRFLTATPRAGCCKEKKELQQRDK
ncbi:hypothetical protein M0R45_037453 [Rubus argutus]|uniref:Uncharacterized protein n=1 Tax=Rubus argutus TaxID=59490 RepID=A0AAW1W460_RUBAR